MLQVAGLTVDSSHHNFLPRSNSHNIKLGQNIKNPAPTNLDASLRFSSHLPRPGLKKTVFKAQPGWFYWVLFSWGQT